MTDGLPSNSNSLKPKLARTDAEIKALFQSLQSVADVANLLEISEKQLTYTIWRQPEKLRYHTWKIKKRNGGIREINAPSKTHKILQSKLSYILQLVAHRRSIVHGFVAEKSIITNARMHSRRRWVLNIDLKDFFPSIHFGRVRGLFTGKPYILGERAATALAQLCCHETRLPQGAPTSPIISNMICTKLDNELRQLAELHGCKCTRYADDITFSTSRKDFPIELATNVIGVTLSPGAALSQVIENNGFLINPSKVRLQSRMTRQEVTGLTVNQRPNVRRKFVSQIRSMLHAWEVYGYDFAQKEFLEKYDTKHRPFKVSDRVYERVIRGKLAFLKQVRTENNSRYVQLRRRLGRLLGEITNVSTEINTMDYDAFICHASEDKN